MPFGFHKQDNFELPESITFTGRLFGESDLLAVAQTFQQATGDHLKHPGIEQFLAESDRSK